MLKIQFKSRAVDSSKIFSCLFSSSFDIHALFANRQAILLSLENNREKTFMAQFDANKSKSIIHHYVFLAVFFLFISDRI